MANTEEGACGQIVAGHVRNVETTAVDTMNVQCTKCTMY